MEVAGPLGTPLGLAQRKRASSPGKAGTSGFLSVSDSDRRVPAELGQEMGQTTASQICSCFAGKAEHRPNPPQSPAGETRAARGVVGGWGGGLWHLPLPGLTLPSAHLGRGPLPLSRLPK